MSERALGFFVVCVKCGGAMEAVTDDRVRCSNDGCKRHWQQVTPAEWGRMNCQGHTARMKAKVMR